MCMKDYQDIAYVNTITYEKKHFLFWNDMKCIARLKYQEDQIDEIKRRLREWKIKPIQITQLMKGNIEGIKCEVTIVMPLGW